MKPALHLKVVPMEPAPVAESVRTPEMSELGLVAFLFLLNLMPVVGELAGVGRWSPAIVGFAAGAVLLTGRELWSQLKARHRTTPGGRTPTPEPPRT